MTGPSHLPDRGAWVWAMWGGLAAVGLSAAVLSFSALADLAQLCGITGTIGAFRLEWLLPIAVDVFAVTATVIWLRRRVSAEAVTFARRAAWAAIGATVGGNAYHGYLVDSAGDPPWVAVVVVSALPAVALGALVHLAVLVGREPDTPRETDPPADVWGVLHDDALAEPWHHAITTWRPQPPAGGHLPPDRSEPNSVLAADLLAFDVARRTDGHPTLTQDGVRDRYRVGATRAATLRRLAEDQQRAARGRAATTEAPADISTAGAEPLTECPVPAGGGRVK